MEYNQCSSYFSVFTTRIIHKLNRTRYTRGLRYHTYELLLLHKHLRRTRALGGCVAKIQTNTHKLRSRTRTLGGCAVINQQIFHKPHSIDSGARQKSKYTSCTNTQRVKIYTRGLPPVQKMHSQSCSNPQARPLWAARDHKAVRECTRSASSQHESCHPDLPV